MKNRILKRITDNLPGRIISDAGLPYLERYYVCTAFGWRFYLHRFVGSDPDRGIHDHPWRKAFSVVLSGWYLEERREGMRVVKWFNRIYGDTFHRVILPQGRITTCWTLFAHTVGDVKPWGFMRELGADCEGAMLFEPYRYEGGAKVPEWWKTAPKGRDLIGRAE